MFQQADLEETLQGIPWFLDLKPEQINQLANISGLRQLSKGEALFTEGGKQDFLYILLDGEITLKLYVPGCGEEQIFSAGPLDILGWDQLTPVVRQRLGSARAMQPCLLIAIDGDALHSMCEDDHELGFVIYRRLANLVASRLLNVRLTLSDTIVRLQKTH